MRTARRVLSYGIERQHLAHPDGAAVESGLRSNADAADRSRAGALSLHRIDEVENRVGSARAAAAAHRSPRTCHGVSTQVITAWCAGASRWVSRVDGITCAVETRSLRMRTAASGRPPGPGRCESPRRGPIGAGLNEVHAPDDRVAHFPCECPTTTTSGRTGSEARCRRRMLAADRRPYRTRQDHPSRCESGRWPGPTPAAKLNYPSRGGGNALDPQLPLHLLPVPDHHAGRGEAGHTDPNPCAPEHDVGWVQQGVSCQRVDVAADIGKGAPRDGLPHRGQPQSNS